MTSSEKIAVLLNPTAGGGKAGKYRRRLENCLQKWKIPYDLFVTENEDHLRLLTRKHSEDYPTLVGAGGDSTLQIMAEEIILAGAKTSLGMIGLGSSNDIARQFSLVTIDRACRALKRGRKRPIDLGGIVHQEKTIRIFIGQANIGLGVWINAFVEGLKKKNPRTGKFQWVAGTAAALRAYQKKIVPIPLKAEAQGFAAEGKFLLAVFTNISYWANGMRLHPDALPDDGILEATLVHPCSIPRLASLVLAARFGKLQGAPEVESGRGSVFRLSSPLPFGVQTDGEVIGNPESPSLFHELEIRTLPRALSILA